MDVKRGNQNSTPLSLYRPTETSIADLDQLESSFMYTQLFKNALLDLTRYYQRIYTDNLAGLVLAKEFRREYRAEKAIWRYTRPIFIYGVVNRALRLLEADIIGNIKELKIDKGRLFDVQLILTAKDDIQLRLLTERFVQDSQRFTGRYRIGKLLVQVGELEKAEEIYLNLLEQTCKPIDVAVYSHELGSIKCKQGDYGDSFRYYK